MNALKSNQNQNNTTYLITEQQLPSYPVVQQAPYPMGQPAYYVPQPQPQPQPVYTLPVMDQIAQGINAQPQPYSPYQPYGQPIQQQQPIILNNI